MSFDDWYEFVDWGWEDETPFEKAQRAHRYWIECFYSIQKGSATSIIKNIAQRLFDIHNEEAEVWLMKIMLAVGNINIINTSKK